VSPTPTIQVKSDDSTYGFAVFDLDIEIPGQNQDLLGSQIHNRILGREIGKRRSYGNIPTVGSFSLLVHIVGNFRSIPIEDVNRHREFSRNLTQ
jgi:hypothetical protein